MFEGRFDCDIRLRSAADFGVLCTAVADVLALSAPAPIEAETFWLPRGQSCSRQETSAGVLAEIEYVTTDRIPCGRDPVHVTFTGKLHRDAIDAFLATLGSVIEATTGELRNYETGDPDAEYESIVFGGTPEGRETLRLAKAVEAAESTAGVVFSDDERARMSRLIRDAQLRTKSH